MPTEKQEAAPAGTEGRPSFGDWLLERVLGWFVPRFVSLPLLLVLALFRALRFERGLAWLRGRGGVGLFCWIDTLWLVGTITLLFRLVFGRRAYGLGILAGLFLFVLLHSLIAHAADYFTGYDPAEEFMRPSTRGRDEPASGGRDEEPAGNGDVDGDGSA
jgi:hypothetical protein